LWEKSRFILIILYCILKKRMGVKTMVEKFITSDKINYYPSKLAVWELGLLEQIIPVTIEMHPSNICNNKCYYCFAEKQKDGRLMKFDDALKIIDKLSSIGVKGLILSGGGEPTLHPNIIGIINYASTKGLRVGLITNAVKLSQDLMREIIVNCDWVRVSLDSVCPSTYKKIRGTDSCSIVLKNLQELVKLKKELKSHCTIGTQSVVSEKNKEDLYDTALMLNDIGVDYYQMRPLENETYSREFYDIIENTMNQIVDACFEMKIIISGKWKIINPNLNEEDRGYTACHAFPFIGAITVDGKIYICCHHVGIEKYCYGNMVTDNWSEISKKRIIIAKNIDLKYCPKACRGNQINCRLEGLKRGVEHQSFL